MPVVVMTTLTYKTKAILLVLPIVTTDQEVRLTTFYGTGPNYYMLESVKPKVFHIQVVIKYIVDQRFSKWSQQVVLHTIVFDIQSYFFKLSFW